MESVGMELSEVLSASTLSKQTSRYKKKGQHLGEIKDNSIEWK